MAQVNQEKTVDRSYVILWGILLVIFVAGILLAYLDEYVPWGAVGLRWLHPLVAELAVAMVTTAILAMSVDRVLKIEIIRDVFQAAFHYVLPNELKGEINRIIGYRVLAFDAQMIVHIDPLESDLVKVTVRIERTLTNKSRSVDNVYAIAAVDEWGLSETRSAIQRCELHIDGKIIYGKTDLRHDNPSVSIGCRTDNYPLKPGCSATTVAEFYEIYRDNGSAEVNFTQPHVRPTVDIRAAPSIEYSFDFGAPDVKYKRLQIEDSRTLEGTYFPGQRMRIRWWPKTVVIPPPQIPSPTAEDRG